MVAQRQLLGAAFGPVAQREPQGLEEELPVQGKALALQAKQVGSGSIDTVQAQTEVPAEANLTGMPNQLKSGVEALSGMDMSDVRVHRNSDKPAQLNALAYAQGNEIHLGPGQEHHLPHEAWHVVQQRQGRVQATVQMAGVGVNDDVGLEEEADAMGEKAESGLVQLIGDGKRQDLAPNSGVTPNSLQRATNQPAPVAQLTQAELTNAKNIWNGYSAKHGVVDGHVQADITALQDAYNHYALPANGGRNDAGADNANSFLRNSVSGLLHDIAEIDSHAGGYYYQQEVKAGMNVARSIGSIVNQQGAHGGISNATDPDVSVVQGGGTKKAVEVKRTTKENGLDGMLHEAIEQLSKRKGYSGAEVHVEITSPFQAATVKGNLGAVRQTVENHIACVWRRLGEDYYYKQATPFPGGLFEPYIILTVKIQYAGTAALIYDRDFQVHLEQEAGRRGAMRHSVQAFFPLNPRV
ncbi:DUF4157 domain-containing protein [Sphaerotilus montanus]|nr:DUF4157 domain-containing protein [Sphaerotilus montanus]